ncbi:MAG: FAD-dependent oxidoreductase [Candidatus Hydrogenedentes bacterium]|nr:FAD-dependent oxidoreductase [Candidatus Hydrogenedentota bacterium]
MHKLPVFMIALMTLAGGVAPPSAQSENHAYDVVVYGATAGGVVAAIAAANEGLNVALVEPRQHIGGMTSGGLGATDFGRKTVIGGMAREFYKRLGRHYGEEISWYFEPHKAEKELRAWLKEAKVSLYLGSRLGALEKSGTVIKSITLLNGTQFSAPIFIDCSYEGDFLPLANISYTWGRESSAQYDESLAGHIEYSEKHQFTVPVNPYDDEGKLLPLVYEGDDKKPGDADKKIQGYNFRLCMTQDKNNMVSWPKPEGYDPAEWEILRRYLAVMPGLKFGKLCNPVFMPKGKTDTNNNGPISTDFIGGSWGYPDGTYEEQAEIWAAHERYVKGFFYFLANDPSVPDALQTEARSWGLAKDEFVDTDNWPHQLYVREARRMIGSYVTRQKDLQEERHKDDSIGMASYNSDSHNVQRFAVTESPLWPAGTPSLLNEGDMQVRVRPYDMPYRSFVPREKECTNLLVGSTFSASHVAYSSMRMEPQYMIIGQAAGIAAALAIKGSTSVQAVDIQALQDKLHAQGAILHLEETVPEYKGASNYAGFTMDDDKAEIVGDWFASESTGPFVGYNYLHERKASDPENYVRYRVKLPKAGRYEVRVSYTAYSNRATNALYVIHHADGAAEHRIDQRKKQGKHSPFVTLGIYRFEAGNMGYVDLVSTADAGGYVIADAVQWLPVE